MAKYDQYDSMTDDALLSEIRHRIVNERGVAAALRIVLASLALMLAPLAVVLFDARPDIGAHPLAIAGVTVGAVLLLCALAPSALRGLERPMLKWEFVAALVAGALVAPMLIAFLPGVSNSEWVSGALYPHGVVCFGVGVLMAALPLAFFWLLDRSVVPSRGRTVLAASAAGLSAFVGLELGCGILTHAHILLAHGGVVVAVVLGCVLLERFRLAS